MLVMFHSLPEKGEVFSAHYKLLPSDLRDVQQLHAIITHAGLDPRYVLRVISLSISCSFVYSCEILLPFTYNLFVRRHQSLLGK